VRSAAEPVTTWYEFSALPMVGQAPKALRRATRSSMLTALLPPGGMMSAGQDAGGTGQGPKALRRATRSSMLMTPLPPGGVMSAEQGGKGSS